MELTEPQKPPYLEFHHRGKPSSYQLGKILFHHGVELVWYSSVGGQTVERELTRPGFISARASGSGTPRGVALTRCVRALLPRSSCDSGAPADLVALMQRCWDHEPDARPTFAAIKAELRGGLDTPAR